MRAKTGTRQHTLTYAAHAPPGTSAEHRACFTPKRSLVRTQYRPRISHLVKGISRESSGLHATYVNGFVPRTSRWALWANHIGRPWFAAVALLQGLDAPGGTVSPSSPWLASSPIPAAATSSASSYISSTPCRPRSVSVWPTAPTITTPARYNEVASTAMRLLAEASTMLARNQSKQTVVTGSLHEAGHKRVTEDSESR
jgi:hypothetical protein